MVLSPPISRLSLGDRPLGPMARSAIMNEETLFHLARAKPAAERDACLQAACADDAGLRRHLEAILAAYDHLGSFLARPPVGPEATAGLPSDRSEDGDHPDPPSHGGWSSRPLSEGPGS